MIEYNVILVSLVLFQPYPNLLGRRRENALEWRLLFWSFCTCLVTPHASVGYTPVFSNDVNLKGGG
eukprot:scaffold4157_cov189-Skeletonema_menzelii.AAC.2